MNIKQISTPETIPISSEKLSIHLRLADGFSSESNEDANLLHYIKSATQIIEHKIQSAIVSKKYSWTLKAWPSSFLDIRELSMPLERCTHIESINITASDGSTRDIFDSNWHLLGRRLYCNTPVPRLHTNECIVVQFWSGFGKTQDDVPDDIKQAVLLLAAHYFESRYASGNERLSRIPYNIEEIIEYYRPIRV
jgi:uncharacterized phiE125 gp8 family phage protein